MKLVRLTNRGLRPWLKLQLTWGWMYLRLGHREYMVKW